jgi:Neprosin
VGVRRTRRAWLVAPLALLGLLAPQAVAASARPAGVRCVHAPRHQPATPPDSWRPSPARVARLRVCPAGKTPEALASARLPHAGDKGIPVLGAGGFAKRVNSGYHYVSFYEYPEPEVPGTYADMTVAKPALDTRDSHTLAEVAAQSADGQQIVEIGWTVDRLINGGSAAPHLFTFSWINGVGQGYNAANSHFQPFAGGSGWNPNSYFTGMELPVSATPRRFVIWHYQGKWLLGLGVPGTTNIDYVGYFPDSDWSGGYTSIGLAQWFGEVNDANDGLDCTEMGNGIFGTTSGAATVGAPALIQNDAGDSVAASPDLAPLTDPGDYDGRVSTGNFGGPGPCVAPPPHTQITQHPAAKVKTRRRHARVTFGFSSTASRFRCSLDGGFSRCSSPSTYRVGLGRHSFSVKATDTLGQTGPAATFHFKVVRKHRPAAG